MISKIMSIQQRRSRDKNSSSAIELLRQYCKDIENWPSRWEISKQDLAIGQSIRDQLKQFLISRIEKGRSKRTVKMYAGYLWVLGGELIRQLNEDESERGLLAKDLILKYIDDSGGLYWRHARDEVEHAQYDSVCRQLFKFMTQDSG